MSTLDAEDKAFIKKTVKESEADGCLPIIIMLCFLVGIVTSGC